MYWVGKFVLNKIHIELRSNIEKLVFAFAVGNLIISTIIHYLGIFHLYYSQIVLLIYIFPLLPPLKHLPLVTGLKFNFTKYIFKIFKSQVNVGEVLIYAFLVFTYYKFSLGRLSSQIGYQRY